MLKTTTTEYRKPISTRTLAYGTYAIYARVPCGHRAKHPVIGSDLGESHDELMRVQEGKRVWWRIGWGVGSDGCAYGGGMLFKTKRAAVAMWRSHTKSA